MGLFFNEDLNTLFIGASEVSMIYIGDIKVWPSGLPIGTIFDFEYTGTVQEITLPAGKYKLQCWGAQGGTSAGSYNSIGSNGGYSEGIITLTEEKTFYVFVGGQGGSSGNGGWNGGGGSSGSSYAGDSRESGASYPACGGGSTDIALVTSDMSYSNKRTNRSSESLLSRCIVAGGGAGGSYAVKTQYITNDETVASFSGSFSSKADSGNNGASYFYAYESVYLTAGQKYDYDYDCDNCQTSGLNFTSPSGSSWDPYWTECPETGTHNIEIVGYWYSHYDPGECYYDLSIYTSSYSEQTNTYNSNKSQQGGGVSGKGQYPGTQSSAGSNGGFGYGANQETTNYMYCSGGAGGGWYGGGASLSDYSTDYINYSGGGSGFVNTLDNASLRPQGYTGLQLDSGTTIAGDLQCPAVNGGNETGHSGNGYARITVIE